VRKQRIGIELETYVMQECAKLIESLPNEERERVMNYLSSRKWARDTERPPAG
jgi:hypothetical protein